MDYEGIVYRPPSEAGSFIIQVIIGCAHNRCTFCDMYKKKKFRMRSMEEIYADLEEAREVYGHVDRIFLADGDALVLPMDKLRGILLKIKSLFPECSRISSYAAPGDVLAKSQDNMSELKTLGLKMLYMGVESGSDEILKKIKKGADSRQIIEAGKKIRNSGIKLSTTFISGIGGKKNWEQNAVESAKVINSMKPDYVGLLTLMVEDGTELSKDVESGKFELLNPREVMLETRELIKDIDIDNCIFRSNHASNYVALGGTLSQDRQKLLDIIDKILKGNYGYKSEEFRML
ncbi:MAG TPA: radical SAM protein [Clostridium sp.]|nr:radical SAM protein [Clostridiales bacterium]HBC95331.1 radical SAM protein [Clostridium sp.]